MERKIKFIEEATRARALKAQLDRQRAAFITLELESGLTFLDTARATQSTEVRQRNQDNAQKALDTARHFLGSKPELTSQHRERLGALERKLAERIAVETP